MKPVNYANIDLKLVMQILTSKPLNIDEVRREFPILHRQVRGCPLVYFDNAATTQKPKLVIDRIHSYYRSENANIHRGIHYLSEKATLEYESVRKIIQSFLNARHEHEIIFTSGTTACINLVASSFSDHRFQAGDEVIISTLEHHSNIVPWQIIRDRIGIQLKVVPVSDCGEFILDAFKDLLSDRTRLVSVTQVSNAIGTITPIKKVIDLSHEFDVPVLVDGAQAIPHKSVDVQDLDCDFYAFSGHKLFGPTGIGILYGKEEYLESMPPYQGGGDMIQSVSFDKTTYNSLPYKFEAGTPNIAGVLGLGAAIQFVNDIGMDRIDAHIHGLLTHARQRLSGIDDIRVLGPAGDQAGIVSFVGDNVHPHDIGTILDLDGIAIRAGHHCSQPLMERLGVPATSRASFALYNTIDEIDRLVEVLPKAIAMLR